MAITRTIGKNTLGDNNKMQVRLREYDMSSQNLSYVFRSTMGVGMLVPFMKIVCQKGDIFDIQLTNKTMTHPTLGPLFGSFKLQHFIFTAGFRLYNSWLHNNRTGIGMKMSDIKLPVIPKGMTDVATAEVKYNPSSIYSYLGWKGTKQKGANDAVKNGIPLLIYLDIFKNYFANTQEDNFYIIIGNTNASVTIDQQNQAKVTVQVGTDAKVIWQAPMNNEATLEAGPEVKDYANFWKSIKIRFSIIMCLYPKLIPNKRYLPTKKNGGVPPVCPDERLRYVTAACGDCYECRKQKQRQWVVRMSGENRQTPNAAIS